MEDELDTILDTYFDADLMSTELREEAKQKIRVLFIDPLGTPGTKGRKRLKQRKKWLESKLAVSNMTNAPLFKEELQGINWALSVDEICQKARKELNKENSDARP